jgi:hypothetical protein
MAGAGEGRGQEVDRDLRKRGVREEEGEARVNFDGGVFVGWIGNGEIYLVEGMCVEEVGGGELHGGGRLRGTGETRWVRRALASARGRPARASGPMHAPRDFSPYAGGDCGLVQAGPVGCASITVIQISLHEG